jgi:dienelactone hydrolase
VGYLAFDDSFEGKRPGVLVLPEWWGLNDYVKGRADQLAQMGYVAFAADMYGDGFVTDEPKVAAEHAGKLRGSTLLADRAKAALDQLAAVAQVDKSRLAAIGFCFGGSAAQVLAYSGAPVIGIVSFHGGPVNAPPAALGMKTKFLLLNGAIDPTVKPEAKAAFEESLNNAKIDYQSIDYAGALHAFTNPDADGIAARKGMTGQIGYNEVAANRSWKQMQVFFDELFGTPAH